MNNKRGDENRAAYDYSLILFSEQAIFRALTPLPLILAPSFVILIVMLTV